MPGKQIPGWDAEIVAPVLNSWAAFCIDMYAVVQKHFKNPAEGCLACVMFLAVLVDHVIVSPRARVKVRDITLDTLEWSWENADEQKWGMN